MNITRETSKKEINYKNFIRKLIREELNKLYHGSPHDHNKFDTTKILSGEGNISFGWGLYFTDSESIARHYANSLSKPKIMDGNNKQIPISNELGNLMKMVYTVYGILDEDAIKKYIKNIARNFNSLDWVKKAIIEYNKLPENFKLEPFRFLYQIEGFDKPLDDFVFMDWHSEVNNDIKQILNKNNVIIDKNIKNGADLYHFLVKKFNSEKNASLFLRDIGVDGIVYGSGTLMKSPFESKAKNYVIFDDKNIKIKDKKTF